MAQQAPGSFGVAVGHGVGDFKMLFGNRDHVPGGARGADASTDGETERLPGLAQYGVAGGVDNHLVEANVVMEIADDVAAVGRGHGSAGLGAQLLDLAAQGGGAELHRQLLEDRANLVGLAAFAFADLTHTRSAVGGRFNEARRFEGAEGLAHRGLADIELARDLHLDEAGAGGISAVDDAFHQNLMDAVGEGRPGDIDGFRFHS